MIWWWWGRGSPWTWRGTIQNTWHKNATAVQSTRGTTAYIPRAIQRTQNQRAKSPWMQQNMPPETVSAAQQHSQITAQSTAQHRAAQSSTERRSETQHSTAQHNGAEGSADKHGAAQQHSEAHSTEQHTATLETQHYTDQHRAAESSTEHHTEHSRKQHKCYFEI